MRASKDHHGTEQGHGSEAELLVGYAKLHRARAYCDESSAWWNGSSCESDSHTELNVLIARGLRAIRIIEDVDFAVRPLIRRDSNLVRAAEMLRTIDQLYSWWVAPRSKVQTRIAAAACSGDIKGAAELIKRFALVASAKNEPHVAASTSKVADAVRYINPSQD